MVAAGQIGQLDHADRPLLPDPSQQGKQRPVQRDARLAQEQVVGLGPIEEAGEVHHRRVNVAKFGFHPCILHIFS
ncbi:hypothetical protein ACRAWD_03985 [Caulobacter segnis]